jgi:hypothetical protein
MWPYKLNFRRAETRSGDSKRRPGRSRDPLEGLRGSEARSADAENLTRPRRDNVRANRDPIPTTAGEFPTTEIWPSVRRTAPSFVENLDLLVDHLPGKAVHCHMHPVMLFALSGKVRRASTARRDSGLVRLGTEVALGMREHRFTR